MTRSDGLRREVREMKVVESFPGVSRGPTRERGHELASLLGGRRRRRRRRRRRLQRAVRVGGRRGDRVDVPLVVAAALTALLDVVVDVDDHLRRVIAE